MSSHATSFLIVLGVPVALLAIEGCILYFRARAARLDREKRQVMRLCRPRPLIPFGTQDAIERGILRKL